MAKVIIEKTENRGKWCLPEMIRLRNKPAMTENVGANLRVRPMNAMENTPLTPLKGGIAKSTFQGGRGMLETRQSLRPNVETPFNSPSGGKFPSCGGVRGGLIITVLTILSLGANAQIIDQGNCGANGNNLTWILTSDSTLTISGSGDMHDFTYSDYAPWYSNKDKVKTAIINDGVTTIGNNAFLDCTQLTSVSIPNSVTTIGDGAFLYCRLTSVSIPNSVTTIGGMAFNGCRFISVNIPNSVMTIGYLAFYSCTQLISIDVDNMNPNYSSINGILYNKLQDTLIQCPGGKMGIINIPNSVKTIEWYAFYSCIQLTSVNIPNTVTTIGHGVFSNCSQLTTIDVDNMNPNYSSIDGILYNKLQDTLIQCPTGKTGTVNIPNSVTTIRGSAFEICSNLTSINIGNSVITIENYAFNRCSKLTFITCNTATPPILGINVFNSVPKTIPVYIPCGTYNNYSNDSEWSSYFSNFIEDSNCNPSISGNVLRQNQTFLSAGTVMLYKLQTLSQYTLIDAVPIESDGSYLFSNVQLGSYIVKAVPQSSENALPTYHLNTEMWNHATVVTVGNLSVSNVNITLVPAPSLNGSSLISGYVGDDGHKSISHKSVENPVEDVDVYLQKEQSTWVTVASTLTNAEGYFEFRNVSAGKYRVILDIPGIEHKEIQIIEINDGDTVTNIEYEITEDGIKNKTDNVGIAETPLMASVRIYPNPAGNQLIVEIAGQVRNDVWDIEIYDVVGKMVLSCRDVINHVSTINVESLASGLYFLKIDGKVVKFVKE